MIKVKKHKWAQDYVSYKGKDFSIAEIIKYSEKTPTTIVPIEAIDHSIDITSGNTDILEFSEHVNRVIKADMKYPIILAPNGYLLDGRHRLARGLIDKHNTVKVKRLKGMPPYWRVSTDTD